MNRISKAALTTASAAGLLLGVGTAAHADTVSNGNGYSEVTQSTANGFGEAYAYWSDSGGSGVSGKTSATYVTGEFWDYDTDYTLNAWLERSTDGGADWSTVSGVHNLVSGDTDTDGAYAATDAYYDGPGYLVRACFEFTSWSGAADHCTDWI